MLKIAAIAFMPIAAVLFGFMAIGLAMVPGLRSEFALAVLAFYGAAVLSFLLAIPLSFMVARRMAGRREKRVASTGRGLHPAH
ncbi:hypothetical protein [Niveispirillum sp. KHB5.9]|uniref:hypothetical protein n=1 Tax=Niveispirillum sp. KHB5.9 TaxID=3400269 RepID=UPI003A8902AE